MHAVAVGRLNDHIVGIMYEFSWTQKRRWRIAEIARKKDLLPFAPDLHDRRAQYMPGVMQYRLHAIFKLDHFVVFHAFDKSHNSVQVFLRKKRLAIMLIRLAGKMAHI